ncbi:hypothetical protein [Vibrio parahaemolyticus]|uniref:hypothetical protein n=1 Tax=Vibrio parahaemolyticus TaxID=670 RepID=UPI00111DD32F|nr:hypothetical protein [Vibrio parahaemolyticus]TOG40353.1 hypothetical protein CGJ02_16100 [Vibrio parahaemolyticus]
MSRSKFVLCQDCLKVSIYSDARHNEDELCTCGGQFCGCSHCNAQAEQIVADDKNHVLHGLSDAALFELSEA